MTPDLLQFTKAEVAKLFVMANYPAKENVLAVKLDSVPGPLGIGRKELDPDHGILDLFLGIKSRQLVPDLFGEELRWGKHPGHLR